MATKISVNHDSNAQKFWDYVHGRKGKHDVPRAVAILAGPDDEIVVSDAEADAARRWCGTIPGFGHGPAYAPTALRFDQLPEPRRQSLEETTMIYLRTQRFGSVIRAVYADGNGQEFCLISGVRRYL